MQVRAINSYTVFKGVGNNKAENTQQSRTSKNTGAENTIKTGAMDALSALGANAAVGVRKAQTVQEVQEQIDPAMGQIQELFNFYKRADKKMNAITQYTQEQLEQFKKADQYFEYALSLFGNNDNIQNNKGILYSIKYEIKKMEDDYEKALMMFNDILSSNYLDSELLNNRATLYSVKYKIKGDDNLFQKALKDYNDLIEMDFNNIYALNNRSALFFNKYKYSGDKKYFDKSIEDCNTAFKINFSESLYDNTGTLYIYKF